MNEKEKRIIDVFCQSCNVQIAADVVATHVQSNRKHWNPDSVDDFYDVIEYVLVECGRCESVSLVQLKSTVVPGEISAPQGEQILYPANQRLSTDDLPVSISSSYHDAARSFKMGLYEPCVIMCRKCLEALCLELNGNSGRNLKQKLKLLYESGQIDEQLFSWAEQLRDIGNDAAHNFEAPIKQRDARDAFEFLEAILMYTFLLNRRFEAFKARRKKD